jgi:2-C-methyl-D-erythritol 4-phosphate cytidylyltransferase/2-C-methyl-D-erythritol 2,4-cyclodiphosphate synthase
MSSFAVVLLAAGRGERLGANQPKAFVSVTGRSLLEHALGNVLAAKGVAQVVLACPQSHLEQTKQLVAGLNASVVVDVVVGGQTRQQSIANALAKVSDHPVVLVHDSARAFASSQLFENVAAAVTQHQCGILPVLPVVDTIKRVDGHLVQETIDRDQLRIAQTPQGFPTAALKAAYATPDAEHTDDASLFQWHGGKVICVAGEPNAFKVTTAPDLLAAQQLLEGGMVAAESIHAAPEQRSGIGTDVHRFSENHDKPLMLAAIEWPGERALEGHSDGDAVAHATVDALLSAAGLGDIGSNFGVDRPEYAGASGAVFLSATVDLLALAGWKIVNVSVQVIGNRPKLAPRRDAAQQAMSGLVGAPVTIGATTTDGLGFLGDSQGIGAVATALIQRTAKVG